MKTSILLLASVIGLVSCGGGQTGNQGAPGKSAYEIWLEQGNVGTEQDYLDSLVSNNNNSGNNNNENKPADNLTDVSKDEHIFKNTKDYLDAMGHNYSEANITWPGHNEFKQYTYRQESSGNINSSDVIYTYNEKELNLGNYGVYLSTTRGEFAFDDIINAGAYIHNRNGVGANVYAPQNGTTFKGGTLAYLHGSSRAVPVLLTGEGVFIYDNNASVLKLAFDNYYTLTIEKNFENQTRGNIAISGTNLTGMTAYDLESGTQTDKYITTDTGYTKLNNHEEAFISYGMDFNASNDSDFKLTGAFGGAKQ